MKKFYLFFLFLLLAAQSWAQHPNDNCSGAVVLPFQREYCSGDAAYTTAGATASFLNSGNDVWFKVTAYGYNLHITVGGLNAGGTLTAPVVAMYNDCNGSGIIGRTARTGNLTTFDASGLVIGRSYYVSVSGSNAGSFKFCTRYDIPIANPGSDCATAAFLCSKNGFVQTTLNGPGNSPDEGRGTCLEFQGQNSEINSAWYKWQAANNGTLVFTLTPTYRDAAGIWDDIDWALFDMGTADNCNTKQLIRCSAGRGTDCTGNSPNYYKTGSISIQPILASRETAVLLKTGRPCP